MPNARAQPPHLEIQYCDSPDEAAQGADAVVLVTEWEQYRSLDWTALRSLVRQPMALDGRNFWDRAAAESAGFRYVPLH
jgi:UDPglucose 6-dehydrogenase